jgi:SAM-dependent methyltransferase
VGQPWLEIPLADYEGHMTLVGQAQMLADELSGALARHKPQSVAVVGCAGGNGFEALIDPQFKRVVGIDVNACYLQVARSRYAGRIRSLELHCADIEHLPELPPVNLLFAGLIFEYTDLSRAMRSCARLMSPGAHLIAVLQLPGAELKVSPSPFTSLSALRDRMSLYPPHTLISAGTIEGLQYETMWQQLPTPGKPFAVVTLRRPTAD